MVKSVKICGPFKIHNDVSLSPTSYFRHLSLEKLFLKCGTWLLNSLLYFIYHNCRKNINFQIPNFFDSRHLHPTFHPLQNTRAITTARISRKVVPPRNRPTQGYLDMKNFVISGTQVRFRSAIRENKHISLSSRFQTDILPLSGRGVSQCQNSVRPVHPAFNGKSRSGKMLWRFTPAQVCGATER